MLDWLKMSPVSKMTCSIGLTCRLRCADRERLRRYKFKWSDAEKEPIDNCLTVDEFQSFRHPESSKEMVLQMAEEILQYLGQFS